MKKTFLLTLIFLNVNLFSQSHILYVKKANKHFKDHNYIEACLKSMDALLLKPKLKKAQEILSQSFNPAVNSLQAKIAHAEKKITGFKGDKTVRQREEVYSLYVKLREVANKYDRISKVVNSKKYDLNFEKIRYKEGIANAKEQLQEAKAQAAEMYYKIGLKLSSSDDRLENKKAAKSFKKAYKYVENFKDSKERYEKSKVKGSAHVLVFGVLNNSSIDYFSNIEGKLLESVKNELFKDEAIKEFLVFETVNSLGRKAASVNITPNFNSKEWLIQNKDKLGLDAIIDIKIYSINKIEKPVRHYDAVRQTKKVDSGKKENYQNRKGEWKTRSIYIDVFSNVFKHEKKAEASVNLECIYQDLDYDIVYVKDINSAFDWLNMWITYTGDKRAINLGLYKNRDANELPYPSDTVWVSSLVPELTNKIITELRKIAR